MFLFIGSSSNQSFVTEWEFLSDSHDTFTIISFLTACAVIYLVFLDDFVVLDDIYEIIILFNDCANCLWYSG